MSKLNKSVFFIGGSLVAILACVFLYHACKALWESSPLSHTSTGNSLDGYQTLALPQGRQKALDRTYGGHYFWAPPQNEDVELGWSKLEFDTRGECEMLPNGKFNIGHYTHPELVGFYELKFRRMDPHASGRVAWNHEYKHPDPIPHKKKPGYIEEQDQTVVRLRATTARFQSTSDQPIEMYAEYVLIEGQ